MTYPVPAIGTRLTADFLTSMLQISAKKTGTTARTSTVVVSADPDLVCTVEASAVYSMFYMIRYDADTAGDLRYNFTGPTGTTGSYSASALNSTLSAEASDVNFMRDMGTITLAGGLGAGTDAAAFGNGLFTTSSTAGSWSLVWAQGTSSATATNLKANSFMQIKRIG